MTMVVLEVFERVRRARIEEYETLSRETDATVFANEPGMLVHIQTIVARDRDAVTYRWQETFASAEDLKAHGQHPGVQAHMARLYDGILTGPIEVVVYCDWPEERKAKWLARTDHLSFADVVAGYVR